MAVGAVAFRALEHAGENRHLRNRNAVERLSEVEVAGRLESVVAAAEIHFVHVEFHDLALGVGLLNADGRHRFLDLAGKLTFRR